MRSLSTLDEPPAIGLATVVTGQLSHGFVADEIRLAVFTAADLSGQRAADRASRKMPARRKNQIDPLELTSGDPVVHSQHGVGRYVEMVQRTVAGATREYLVIEYAPSRRGQPGDRLYVPMDALDQVTRYVGGENPTLDRMGGADWAKRKGRARKAVREIAAELIKLYAARQAHPRPRVLSRHHLAARAGGRLRLRGDPGPAGSDRRRQAGHGADRADGSADLRRRRLRQDRDRRTRRVQGSAGRQAGGDPGADHLAGAAALRHLRRPLCRLSGQRRTAQPVPVRRRGTRQPSRVSPTAGSTSWSALTGCSSGEVTFKDLGLVVIDEEQRFGVEHKEQLKRLRTHVDVLAMSATPIPRTLEMAITGIREMSTIATPPEERHPVLTFAGPYDEAQVTAAIRRELLREGQVFYVHNRVQSIDKAARRIAELVPEARVVTAHGQMSEQRLEQVMIDFWERRADVLVCTTIVEAGLDISTANTLLIERSDLLGLSQLHQLRGRVGRGRERGYAYFLYPPDKPLTETAYDRISHHRRPQRPGCRHGHRDEGPGDPRRGQPARRRAVRVTSPTSVSTSTSGWWARRLRSSAARTAEPEPEVRIELPVDAHLPADYIESERLRLEMYKRLAEVRSEADVKAVEAELHDRYGTPPPEVLNLIEVARFRLLARSAGLTEIVGQGRFIRFGPARLPESRVLRLQRLYPRSVVKDAAGSVLVPRPTSATDAGQPLKDTDLLRWATELISQIFTTS